MADPAAPPAYNPNQADPRGDAGLQPDSAPEASGVRKRTHDGSGAGAQAAGRAKKAVIESAKRQVGGVAHVATDAVSSGAWAYPLRGAAYIISRLLGPVMPLILRALLISAGVVVACFFFLYLPQVAWLALFTGPLAFIAAVPLVLGEAYLIINFVGKNFLFGQLQMDLFDAVMVQKGYAAMVEKQRPVSTRSTGARQLGKVLSKPLNKFRTDNIVRYVLTLPLNLIPVVGTAGFFLYNGYKSGPSCHARYFQLKGWDKPRREAFVEKRRGAYTGFGIVSLLFNMVPVVGVILGLASSVGAALWAADIEAKSNPTPAPGGEVEVSIPAAR